MGQHVLDRLGRGLTGSFRKSEVQEAGEEGQGPEDEKVGVRVGAGAEVGDQGGQGASNKEKEKYK